MKNFFRRIIGVAAMLIIFLFAQTAGATELVIFHTNDLHGRILQGDDEGQSIGLANIAAAVKAAKAKNPDTLWLDAGDTLHGMPIINISKGRNMVTILNESGLDAMVAGNHEFNYGLAGFKNLVEMAKFPIISANIAYKVKPKNQKTDLLLQPYIIKKLPDGLRVGIFGLTSPETAYKARPTFVKDLNFLNPVDTAREMVKKLRKKCDVLIALTHLGMDESAEFTAAKLARQVQGIDLIVDGHGETTLPEGLAIGNTLIVQTGVHGYNLGRVTIDVEKKKIVSKKEELFQDPIAAGLAAAHDPVVAETIKTVEKDNEKLLDKVIARNDSLFNYDERELCTKETLLGDLAADAIRWRTGADIAIINGAGIRRFLPQGDVTARDVISIFPFGNSVEVVEIQGKAIREVLEHSVFKSEEPFNGFLQISGFDFTFDSRKPIGSRVGLIHINDRLVDDDKIYTLAGSNFLFDGGDDYEMLKSLLVVGQFGTLEEVLSDYVNEVGTQDVYQGRIFNAKYSN